MNVLESTVSTNAIDVTRLSETMSALRRATLELEQPRRQPARAA
jgi:hypothetical protein